MSSASKSLADIFRERIRPRLELLESIRGDNIMTEDRYEDEKAFIIREEMQRINKEEQEKDKLSAETFLPEEIAREPFLKEILNQQDFWKRHKATVAQDPEAWEKRVRDMFIAKSKAGGLSPLLVLIGHYLFFSSDYTESRRHLIEILFLQAADQRLKIHNWLVLGAAPKGTTLTFGKKIENLSFPLFPFGTPDLEQLNSMILDEPSSHFCVGGNSTCKSVHAMYQNDNQVLMGGSGPFPVVDGKRVESGYYGDMEPVHNAFAGLERSVKNHDGQETLHLSFVKKLLEEVSFSAKTRPPRFPSTSGRTEIWSNSNFNKTRRLFPNGRLRGGEALSEPKNEFSPS